ncbi:hypothetical protein AN958_11839 [Leucoagaricus sp. SymC.cos]|nr:hypothetical protein AN958_11839 [Leucoagaricus sp. SymC.cos]
MCQLPALRLTLCTSDPGAFVDELFQIATDLENDIDAFDGDGSRISSQLTQLVTSATEAAGTSRGIKRRRSHSLEKYLPPPVRPQLPEKPKRTPSKRRKHNKRKSKKEADGPLVRQKTRVKLILKDNALLTGLRTEELPAAIGGYQALRYDESMYKSAPALNIEELRACGYECIKWNGEDARPLLDSSLRVIGCLAGRPRGNSWLRICKHVYDLMQFEAHPSRIQFRDKDKRHARGNYPAVNAGTSPGQGSSAPVNLSLDQYEEMIVSLLSDEGVIDIAHFQSFCLRLWIPDLYDHFKTRLDQLFAHPKFGKPLKRITPAGVYPTVAFNFGPDVWTSRHRDAKNCAFGLCAVTALGDFNHETSGHLVLDDLKLIIEFPSGSTILLPSATLTHANIPVGVGQSRASFTQYCPGGLLRFVDQGFRTQVWMKNHAKKDYEVLMTERSLLWKKGLELYPTLDELLRRDNN